MIDIVVEAERAGRKRRVARIVPVGDVDVVLRQHRLDGVAQERREVARERRDQQHARLRGADVLGETQQRAERCRVHRFLDDRQFLVADRDGVDPEGRAHVGQPRARNQLVGGREVLDAGPGHAVHRRERVQCGTGPGPDRHHDVSMCLIRLIEHASRPASAFTRVFDALCAAPIPIAQTRRRKVSAFLAALRDNNRRVVQSLENPILAGITCGHAQRVEDARKRAGGPPTTCDGWSDPAARDFGKR